jgi:hypothetical protein
VLRERALTLGSAALFAQPGRPARPVPYTADWNSLRHHQVPAWFNDAKLGIFIH